MFVIHNCSFIHYLWCAVCNWQVKSNKETLLWSALCGDRGTTKSFPVCGLCAISCKISFSSFWVLFIFKWEKQSETNTKKVRFLSKTWRVPSVRPSPSSSLSVLRKGSSFYTPSFSQWVLKELRTTVIVILETTTPSLPCCPHPVCGNKHNQHYPSSIKGKMASFMQSSLLRASV